MIAHTPALRLSGSQAALKMGTDGSIRASSEPKMDLPAAPHAALAAIRAALGAAGISGAETQAKQLIEDTVATALFLAPELTSPQRQQLALKLGRLLSGEPLQHVLGYQYFFGLRLRAHPGVFCTRPETELVAAHAIELAQRHCVTGDCVRILDLCSGSGAIALAIAQNCPHAEVTAVELSQTAYDSAVANAAELGLDVHFIRADATMEQAQWEHQFDLVVSNPPYIPKRELPQLTRRDPKIALWGGGEDGMRIPTRIIEVAARYLREGGYLLMEHDDTQGWLSRQVAEAVGLLQARTHQDLNGRDRYLQARRPGEVVELKQEDHETIRVCSSANPAPSLQ